MSKVINHNDIELTPGWLLLEPYEPKVEGFVASQNSEDKPNFGRVVNSGYDIGSSIMPSGEVSTEKVYNYTKGDILLFGMQSTATQSINGKIFYLLREEDVIGKVKNTD